MQVRLRLTENVNMYVRSYSKYYCLFLIPYNYLVFIVLDPVTEGVKFGETKLVILKSFGKILLYCKF